MSKSKKIATALGIAIFVIATVVFSFIIRKIVIATVLWTVLTIAVVAIVRRVVNWRVLGIKLKKIFTNRRLWKKVARLVVRVAFIVVIVLLIKTLVKCCGSTSNEKNTVNNYKTPAITTSSDTTTDTTSSENGKATVVSDETEKVEEDTTKAQETTVKTEDTTKAPETTAKKNDTTKAPETTAKKNDTTKVTEATVEEDIAPVEDLWIATSATLVSDSDFEVVITSSGAPIEADGCEELLFDVEKVNAYKWVLTQGTDCADAFGYASFYVNGGEKYVTVTKINPEVDPRA